MKFRTASLALVLLAAGFAVAQTTPRQIARILEAPLQTSDVVAFQLRQYLMKRAPKLPTPSTAQQWTLESKRLRKDLLENVVFHGWPREWVEAPLRWENLGTEETPFGYRIRKIRYEIIPGFQSVAILYEPSQLRGKVPAILNVNGHVGPPGKAIEYKQKRCINYARRGMIALNLEWFFYGELARPGNEHWFGAHLDLVGVHELGLFYLAMRKGLDLLAELPNADPARLGVTGLSGGGWQTIVLSALDDRVSASVPVAGYSSLTSRIERPGDIGDVEQNAADLLVGNDYSHLTAMRAPRPTLLIYNAEDDCCFRAPLVKPHIFDAVKPFYRLHGREDAFAWHENNDPSDHNYQLDNRIQSYRFFARHFGLPAIEEEISVDSEIKSYEDLVVGLPADNLTILGLAKKIAAEIRRPAIPSAAAEKTAWAVQGKKNLARLVRFPPVSVAHAWALGNTKGRGLETRSYRLEMNNGLSATGVWLRSTMSQADAALTIVLNDRGKKAAQVEVSDRVNRGEQVLALDLLFHGDGSPDPSAVGFAQLLATTGDRALGIQAAQLLAAARWVREASGSRQMRLESTGIRTQVVALVAAALEPGLFAEVHIQEGMKTFSHLLDTPVTYQSAPDLFCLDLFKEFDLEHLAALAGPAKVH